MFERFTERARHVVTLAQDEARLLNHNYIGTEHLLLGLLREPNSIAGRALGGLGVALDATRAGVESLVGRGRHSPKGHIPFTPRAKKVLELSLREAMNHGHDYIGTEHLLLGLLREGEGAGAQLLVEQVGDLERVRRAVLELLPPGSARGRAGFAAASGRSRWPRPFRRRPPIGVSVFGSPHAVSVRAEPREEEAEEEARMTPAADASLDVARELAGDEPVGSHHLLLAALGDPNSAAVKALAAMGVDIGQLRQALHQVDVADTSDEEPEEAGRRKMVLRLMDDRVVVEAHDDVLVAAAKGAAEVLGERAGEGGVISGGLPVTRSFAGVWQALRDSLEDIRHLAGRDGEQSA